MIDNGDDDNDDATILMMINTVTMIVNDNNDDNENSSVMGVDSKTRMKRLTEHEKYTCGIGSVKMISNCGVLRGFV